MLGEFVSISKHVVRSGYYPIDRVRGVRCRSEQVTTMQNNRERAYCFTVCAPVLLCATHSFTTDVSFRRLFTATACSAFSASIEFFYRIISR